MRFLLLISIPFISGCKTPAPSGTVYYNDNIPIVNYCDLPDFQQRQIFLKASYSGMDEYWSLGGVVKTKCGANLKVDLQFAGKDPVFEPIPKEYESKFQYVHKNYANSYLLLELIGTFEIDEKRGFGHLNLNTSRFIVSRIVNAKIVQTR